MSSTGSGSDSPPRPRIQRSVARQQVERAGIIQRRIGPGQPAVPDAGSSSSGSEVVGPLPDQAQRHHASDSHVIPASSGGTSQLGTPVQSSPRHHRGLDRGPMVYYKLINVIMQYNNNEFIFYISSDNYCFLYLKII